MASNRLSRIGKRPSLGRYVADIWSRRDFLIFDAKARVMTRNSQHKLGSFWLVGKPLLDVAFYFLVFGVLLKVDRGMHNYVGFISVGVLLFRYTSNALNQSTGILRANRSMIQAFSFPRASLVFSLALREALVAGPLLVSLAIMLMVIPPHSLPGWVWLLALPLLVIQAILNLGVSFIVARIAYSIPDVSQAISFATRILMYGSGVIFPIDRFITHPVVYSVMTGNPVFRLLEMYRMILLDHEVPPAGEWISLLIWAIVLAVIGLIIFWQAEEKYGRP